MVGGAFWQQVFRYRSKNVPIIGLLFSGVIRLQILRSISDQFCLMGHIGILTLKPEDSLVTLRMSSSKLRPQPKIPAGRKDLRIHIRKRNGFWSTSPRRSCSVVWVVRLGISVRAIIQSITIFCGFRPGGYFKMFIITKVKLGRTTVQWFI